MEWKNVIYDEEAISKVLWRIDQKKAALDARRPIPAIFIHRIKESMSIEWTHHSTGIEGNTLSLYETKMVIEEGLTIKGKSLREHFEAVNHHEAIEFVETLISEHYQFCSLDILEIHALVLQKIEKESAGRFRTSGVRISGANFVPPNALRINELIEDLLNWINDSNSLLPIIVKASIFHHRFVWIHPFFDGNGRTARLVFNLLLLKHGYPPAIILKNDRKKYYDALNKANGGDYSKLILLVMQAVERSLDIYLSNLDNNYEDYQPISSIVQDPEVPYNQEYISLLVRQGKIDAFKEGRDWLTTKVAVLEYINKRVRKRVLLKK